MRLVPESTRAQGGTDTDEGSRGGREVRRERTLRRDIWRAGKIYHQKFKESREGQMERRYRRGVERWKLGR